MPRYFFDVQDGRGLHRDRVGDELATLGDAVEQARTILPDILRSEPLVAQVHIVTCDIRDESDRVVYRGKITYEETDGTD